jgi:hypothetical protein
MSTTRFALTVTAAFALACGSSGDGAPIPTPSAWACTGCEIYDLDVKGGKAYLADNARGLVILDVADPAAPKELGKLEAGKPISIRVDGDKAYIGDWMRGLVIVDVSNPAAPTELSVTAMTSGSPYYVEVKGSHLFVPGQVWDVSDPKAPKKVADLPDGSSGNGAWLEGDRLYVGASTDGFKIIDVANPTAPALLGSATADYAKDAVVSGTIAYVPEWNAHGVAIFDVSNPASPTRIGTASIGSNNPGGVAISGNTLVVASGWGGLQLFDVTEPASPASKGEVKLAQNHDTYKVVVNSQGVWAADKKNGLILSPAP